MVGPVHARCGESGSKTIQGAGPVRPEEAEQSTPGVQCRSACLHWRPTRAARRTDCAHESGAALPGDEAHWPTTGVGSDIWTQGLEKSFRNYVRTSFELLRHKPMAKRNRISSWWCYSTPSALAQTHRAPSRIIVIEARVISSRAIASDTQWAIVCDLDDPRQHSREASNAQSWRS